MTKKKKFKDFPGNLIKIKVLEDEIDYFKTQIQEHDTGQRDWRAGVTAEYANGHVGDLPGIRTVPGGGDLFPAADDPLGLLPALAGSAFRAGPAPTLQRDW